MPFSFKLEFDSTKNVAEYEALISGLQVAKQMGFQCISIFGDSELIKRQNKKSLSNQAFEIKIIWE